MNGKYKKKRKLKNDGVSEIIGTVVLLAVAVASFSVLYVTLSATLVTEDSAQVNVIGYIEGDTIVLEHQGGDTLKDNTKIDFVIGGRSQSFTLTSSNDNFTFYDSNNNGEWDVGEKITFFSSESFSGLAVDTSVVDTTGNTALFIGSLQEGARNATPIVDLSTVVEMLPFTIESSPYQINATGSSQLDSVTLYYAFSSSNWTSCSNQTLTYDDFEDGFGNFTSGGSNCDIYTGGSDAHQGNNAIHIQNSGDAASFYLTESVDIDSPSYSTITIDFWFIKNANPGASRQFTIDYYDGSEWQTIITYSLSDYNDDEFYHEQVWINETDYMFPSDMNIRFKGAMPNNNDDVYFDQIYVNATCDDGSSSSEPVWMQYATDSSSPWSWDFSFLNGTGYYQFYSVGEHDARVESAPSTADAFCYYNTTTASDEISIWHFDENAGIIAFDSADGNDGTINGATWTTGVQNSALSFDGDDDHVYVADSENLNFVGNFTAMAWVKWSIDPETGDSWANILNKGRDAQWQIQHSSDNSQFEFAVNTENTRHWAYSSTEVKQGVWYHVAGVYDGSEIRIYVNGSYENQYDLTGDVFVTDYPVNIGRRSDYNDRYFTGIIDEVYLYNRTLSAEELQNYYNQSKPQSSDNDSLIAHWEFDEDTGSIAYDSSGNNNNGTITDATWTTGVNGSALYFDGEGDYVHVPDSNSLDVAEITIAGWMKGNSEGYLVAKLNDISGSGDLSYALSKVSNGKIQLLIDNDGSWGNNEREFTEDVIDLSEWTHVVGTYKDGEYKIYVNGELVDTDGGGQTTGDIYQGAGRVTIGARYDDSESQYKYVHNGSVDEVRIYNRALPIHEIQNLYNNTKPEDQVNLISHWNFNEDAGSTAYDSTDGNNGQIHGASWTAGVNGSGLSFDGDNDYVEVTHSDNLEMSDVNNVSVSMWVNQDEGQSGWIALLQKSDSSYNLHLDNGNTPVFTIFDDDWESANAGITLDSERWYHLVGTFDGSTIKIYVNGSLLGTSSASKINEASSFNIGIGRNLEKSGRYFDGKIDEIKIFNKALSLAEIQILYNETKPSEQKNLISEWKFNENTGSTAYDSTDGNDGNIHGASWTTGVNGSGLNFDGNNDYVEIADNVNLDPTEITLMAWIKHDSVSDHKALIDKRDASDDGYDLYISPSGNAWLRINEHNLQGTTEIDDDTWHHIVGTYDGDEMRVFVDGALENTDTIGSETLDTINPLRIGLERNNDFDFEGIIDDARIYNTALSAQRIQSIYNTSKTVDNGINALWKFDEDGGSIAYDSSDGNDGNIYGATWTTGVSGSALFFDNQGGQDEYVTVSDDENLDLTTEGSVQAWVKINSYQDYAGIIHKGNQNDFSDEAYTLQFWDNGRNILFGGNDDSGDSITIESSEELNLDQWYHLVGTWDVSSIKLYINGALDVEESFTIDAIKDTDGSLQIGAQLTENYPGHGYFGFDGSIDQVALYNTALELNEIQEEYNRLKPDDSTSNPIGHWQFDEGTGSTAFDSINGNDGLINGATWTTGKDESGLNFDGTQQEYVTIPYDNSIALDHNYSIAFWIYPTDETVQWRTFLTRSDQFTCSYIGNDEIRVHVNGYANIDSQTSAPRNSWTHVVFTFENSEVGEDKIIIYMNGESDGQVGPTWGTPNTPTNSLILGGDASSSYFTGSLDEIIIYDKALSADEVSTLYGQYD